MNTVAKSKTLDQDLMKSAFGIAESMLRELFFRWAKTKVFSFVKWSWLNPVVNFILEMVWTHLLVPLIYHLRRKALKQIRIAEIKAQMEAIANAKTDSDFNTAVDDLD